MGYDAFVKCNCFKDGKIYRTPPFQEFVTEDDEGIWLELDWETNKEKHEEFDSWKHSSPCEHSELMICCERLANISGMAAFRNIISDLGSEKYPILSEYMPQANGGQLPAKYAELMKQELESLNLEVSNEKIIVLQELTTGQRVQCTNSKYELPFVFTGFNKLNYIISLKGFQVIKNIKILGIEFSSVVFSSHQFVQKKIAIKKYLLTDRLTSNTYESDINIYAENEQNDEYFEFEVKEMNASIADEYSYIIAPLLKLSNASIQTGNPIIWF